jgi:hypothetical protein
MIPVTEIVTRVQSILDAEGSDRYLFDQDYRPAINSAKDWIVAVFSSIFSDKKVSEENLRDLVFTRVFQTSKFSRIQLDTLVSPHNIWSILSVNPEAVTYPNSTITTPPNDWTSYLRGDLTYIESQHYAKRMTIEQWENMKTNIFQAGSPSLTNNLKTYGYLNEGNYNSTASPTVTGEIEISPKLENKLVGIRYLKYPNNVSLLSDSIEFPYSVLDLFVQKVANFISFKQGDQTNLYTVTQRDISTLIQLMS